MRKDLRLGGITGIYVLYKNNEDMIGDEIKRVITEEVFASLQEFETQEHVFMVSALEVVSLIGPSERSYQRIGVIKALMCEAT